MFRACAIVLMALCLGCSGRKKSDPLVGTYVGWMFIDGKAVRDSSGTSQKLTLQAGGKYVLEVESSVMMSLSIRAEGNYSRVGDQVRLKGTQTVSVDDGYKKEKNTSPHQIELKVVDGMLESSDLKGDPFFFRKKGTGPPPLPAELQLKQSDPDAVALLDKVENAYSSLKSFRATGSVKSNGAGFVAKDAKFNVLFQRPAKFRFESTTFDGSAETDHVEITWGGGPYCWWYSPAFGETRDRSLGNAMSITAVTFGPHVDILPALLLPNETEQASLSDTYPEATLLPKEKIDGTLCAVLQLRSKGADATRLWIDESNGMILKLHEDLRDVTVTFDPHPNASIDAKTFSLGKSSRN